LPADDPGAAGKSLGAVAQDATLAGERPPQGELDRSDGLDGSVRSDAAAGVVGIPEDERVVGGAIAEDVGDLTTVEAGTTNEPNLDENLSSVEEQASIEVTADSCAIPGLDTGQAEPDSDNSARGGEGSDLPTDDPGEAGTLLLAAGEEAMLAGERPPQGELDRSDGLDGSRRLDAVAGWVEISDGGSGDGPVCTLVKANGEVGPTGARAIAEDVVDLTTMAPARATKEPKADEIVSATESQFLSDVPANSAEVSGLDRGHTKPSLENVPSAGDGAGSGDGIAKFDGAMPGVSSPIAVAHSP
jgi:hypothetical protein